MVLLLGVDIGTTSIKACVVQDLTVLSSSERTHGADVLKEWNSSAASSCKRFEQDPRLIFKALDHCLGELSDYLPRVEKIAICGQMHGVVLWKPRENKCPGNRHEYDCLQTLLEETVMNFSNLYTWQDQRCDQSFLNSLPRGQSSCNVASGYGWPTILWLRRNTHDLELFSMCGTIMDFLVWLLTQTEHVVMSTHNAKSWGFFDLNKGCWEIAELEEIAPLTLRVPKIATNNCYVSQSKVTVHDLNKENVQVNVALGDMQCAIRSASPACSEAVLNIGTSSQLSILARRDQLDPSKIFNQHKGVEYVPYDKDHLIVTAASLNGGNVLNTFASNIRSWFTDLDCTNNLTQQELFEKIEHLAKTFKHQIHTTNTLLQVNPAVYGERHDPDLLGTVKRITPNNLSLGSITLAVYKGVIENLLQMLPIQVLKQYGFHTLVGTGGTLAKSRLMQEIAMEIFQTTVRMSTHNDAAYGAVLFSSG